MINFENLARAFVETGELTDECAPEYYRCLYPDLSHMADNALRAHYDLHGRGEGRTGSPADLRFAFASGIDPAAKVLEIGPFTAPTLRGDNIKYFDVLDPDGLRERAKAHNYPIIEPVRIEFVSPTGDLSVVPPGFDVVYSAHCIEHTPDMIDHLQQVHRILNPGGLYMLTIPDMRYTFDYYRTPTKAEDVLRAHEEQRKVHPRDAVIAHYTLSTHNNPAAHWAGDHGPVPRADFDDRLQEAERELEKADGGYVDVHTWFYTPDSFRELMTSKEIRREIGFTVERVYNTPHGYNEFNTVLKKA